MTTHNLTQAKPSSAKPLRLSNDIRQLWTLRALVPLKGWKWLLDDADVYASDAVARLAGLPPLVDSHIDPTIAERREHLVRSWRRAEAKAQRYLLRRPFDRNMNALRSLLGLNAVESQVLALAITAAFDPPFSDLCENFAPLSQHGVRVWSGILSIPSDRIRKAFLPRGKLAVSQILDELSPVWNAASELQVKTPELSAVYSDPQWSPEQLISGFARPLPDAELAPGDFPHHADDIALMVSYLRAAVARRRKGVNILLHGVPGVGKTQLSRIVARSINAQAYEVATAAATVIPPMPSAACACSPRVSGCWQTTASFWFSTRLITRSTIAACFRTARPLPSGSRGGSTTISSRILFRPSGSRIASGISTQRLPAASTSSWRSRYRLPHSGSPWSKPKPRDCWTPRAADGWQAFPRSTQPHCDAQRAWSRA
ncbi:ATP-binding protein [Alkalisalibacterium limincola]|uniref:ATP-binding protein n=1 Tax=Alkalisalibacterium limincola TaxID=2699169 RepID=A0A5C8KL20_9GAMM|nr:ATP-binding protein [Alkalisalibacterium limincola]